MAPMKPEYMIFYVLGREDDLLDDKDVDANVLAEEIMEGADLRTTLITAGTTLAAPLAMTEKREWIKDHRADIDESGGDADEAFRCYQNGRIDAYAHALEIDVVEAMIGEEEDDEDEEEDDEEDDIDEDEE